MVWWRRIDLRRISRGLRFRLTASYALFFAVILLGVAGLFRESLKSKLDSQVEDHLNDDWVAARGYLRIEKDPELGRNAANWYYDAEDPDETTAVLEIKKVYLIADQNGNVIQNGTTKENEISTTYDDLGAEPPAEIAKRVRAMLEAKPNTPGKTVWTFRRNSQGEAFKIRAGIDYDIVHQAPYYVAIGASLADNEKIVRRFTLTYLGVIPGAVILGCFLGWIMTGRVLTPVREVAQTAQRISGSNLSLRIPTRQAGDELDYLVVTFNRMIERLEASFRQMRQFSADVSHELRTPITAIRGQLEVALFTAKTTDQYREAMFNALQDVDRLSQIVRALLLLSQAESGQLLLQKSRLNLCEVVEDLVEQFQIPAEEARVSLAADLPPECEVEADRVQIERMITNLLSNALKFTPKGGSVRVAVHSLPDRVEIVVEDNGRGIAPEFLPHIFDRFYRVPGSGTAPGPEQGLGLGLSFVAWIVKAHHGKIEVDSTPGEGTRFTIKLPPCGVGADTIEMAVPSASLQ
ncbi:MAG TPA: heavy metal sensor histidine kinase [Bryobacteraceae bacterium]|nr:heavy metal sensor histidine kinase [Bryobacteraceae bacterium]